jgi:hypothetical protein
MLTAEAVSGQMLSLALFTLMLIKDAVATYHHS